MLFVMLQRGGLLTGLILLRIEFFKAGWGSIPHEEEEVMAVTNPWCDQGGSPLKVRPFHCTSIGLTLAITPNVGNSSV